MVSLLLPVIYMAFISLGLPDSLLGSAWPIMQTQLDVPLSYCGVISMIISVGTVISSLFSDKLNKRLGTGLVTSLSVMLTAFALFGFSVSDGFVMLCIFAVPYGLGAGAVDAALNNYVALHYSSRHMSWLHCFWGVGAALGPYIMSIFIAGSSSWQGGYRCISIIQIVLTAVLFISLPLWKKREISTSESGEPAKEKSFKELFRIKGVKAVLVAFFCYCAVETTTGLWASSYLVDYRNTDSSTAAKFASLFYIGITVGRFICGFVADKVGDKNMVRIGVVTMCAGMILIMLPTESSLPALIGLVVIGFGCAPVYPSIIHATPANFGRENSQALIGIQMASAYCGTTLMPPVFGFIAQNIGIRFYPFYLLIFAALIAVMTEILNKKTNT